MQVSQINQLKGQLLLASPSLLDPCFKDCTYLSPR